ncbi:MAG: tetratricopeptide repeat protein [Deltaproteobacteria bacterium]|nr:tetratricopeptide repeat protein [Deltaproteobacteria bacterium]
MISGRVREPPPEIGVPAWIWPILQRGLAVDPAMRHESMAALCAELGRDPERRRGRALSTRALIAFGQARMAAGDVATSAAALREALACAERAGDAELQARARLELAIATAHEDGGAGAALGLLEEAARLVVPAGPGLLDRELANARALVHEAAGELEEAAVWHTRAHALAERDGASPEEKATALNNLGDVLRRLGRPDEARAHHEEALGLARATGDPWHPEIGHGEDGLARVAESLGRYGEAAEHFARAMEHAERRLGRDHPRVAQIASFLGEALREAGRLDEARAAHARALSVCERSLGPDTPQYASALNNLALVEMDRGEHTSAVELAEKAVAAGERLGLDEAARAGHLDTLGNALERRGDRAAAVALFRAALAMRERSLGPRDPAVAASHANLGATLLDGGELVAAREHTERALALWEASLAPGHPDIAVALSNLAAIEARCGRAGEACALHARAIEIRRASLGPDHPDVAQSHARLAELAAASGKHDEAAEHYGAAARILARLGEPWRAALAAALHGEGRALLGLGRPAQAAAPLERALALHLEPDPGLRPVGLGRGPVARDRDRAPGVRRLRAGRPAGRRPSRRGACLAGGTGARLS